MHLTINTNLFEATT